MNIIEEDGRMTLIIKPQHNFTVLKYAALVILSSNVVQTVEMMTAPIFDN